MKYLEPKRRTRTFRFESQLGDRFDEIVKYVIDSIKVTELMVFHPDLRDASPEGDLYVLDGAPKMARVRKLSNDGKLETVVVVDAESLKSNPEPGRP